MRGIFEVILYYVVIPLIHRFKKIILHYSNPSAAAISNAAILPEEIIFDILSRLPGKSLGQFRCVSKHWCSLLSDPHFIKAHLATHCHKEQDNKLILGGFSLGTITFTHQNGIDVVSRKLNFPQLKDKRITRVAGSCNGLVLVVDREKINYLINPTTLEYHRIPNTNWAGNVHGIGLGYDFVSDDYKVVALTYCGSGPGIFDIFVDSISVFVDVYSVREGIWRRLESPRYRVFDHASGVLVNEALHWLVIGTSGNSIVVVAFGLNDETFLELPTPTILGKVELIRSNLVALRGCLCMFTNTHRGTVDVWMMKDYGVEESWTKFEVQGPDNNLWIPLCLMNEDDLVLLNADGGLIVYNMREDQWWNMMVDGIPTMCENVGTFRESLVSPTFG